MTRQSRKQSRLGRGALWVIAVILIASGGIRLATGTGTAIAREVENMAKPDPSEPMAAPEICNGSQSIETVLAALSARSDALEKRESAMADKVAALALAEQEIEKNLAAMILAEDELGQTLALADEAAEGDLARLTAVYENMKPKEAAALFEEMAPDFAAGFLGRMRPDAAAAIMAGLEPPTAYTISVVLAGRNANVPTE